MTVNPIINEVLKKRSPKHSAEEFNGLLHSYNVTIKELADKNKIQFADLYGLIMKHGGATEAKDCLVGNPANGHSNDGVHLTAEGYRLMANLFEPIFKGKIKPGDVVVCLGDSITYGAGARIGYGTAYGKTYPAWLSVILNRMVGYSDLKAPPLPEKYDQNKMLTNSSFERCTDRVHADDWELMHTCCDSLAEVKSIKDKKNAVKGDYFLQIKNPDPKREIIVWNNKRIQTYSGTEYKFSFRMRGSGKIQLNFFQYKNGKYISTYKNKSWVNATPKWRAVELNYLCSQNITHIIIAMKVLGNVDLDDADFVYKNGKPNWKVIPANSDLTDSLKHWQLLPHAIHKLKMSPLFLSKGAQHNGHNVIGSEIAFASGKKKNSAAGYAEFRWTAPHDAVLPLSQYEVMVFQYKIILPPESRIGSVFSSFTDNWSNGRISLKNHIRFVSDGEWHTVQLPLSPFSKKSRKVPDWDWQVKAFNLNFYLYTEKANTKMKATVLFSNLHFEPKSDKGNN